jgi:hypothetical protein
VQLKVLTSMSVVDSETVFSFRARELGLSDGILDNMTALGWLTFGTFSFSCAYIPGHVHDQALVDSVIVPVLGGVNDPRAALLRRLFFESYTMTAADLKRKVERTEDDAPRKLPPVEVAARLLKVQADLAGLSIDEDMEPSQSLLHTMVQFVEDGNLKYVAWETCAKREQEIHGITKDQSLKIWQPDANGVIKEKSRSQSVLADTSTDLKIRYALQRRGVAAQMAHLMSFKHHEKIVALLFREMARDPPAGFAPVSPVQAAQADREIWTQLARACRGSLGPDAMGNPPLDAHVDAIVVNTTVLFLLMPRPGRAPAPTPHPGPTDGVSFREQRQPKPKVKVKKDLPNQKKTDDKRMPKDLRGLCAKDPQGRRICYGFNLGTCTSTGDCAKGLHKCCKPRRFGNHPQSQCAK